MRSSKRRPKIIRAQVRIPRIQDCDNDTFVDTDEDFLDPDVVHIRANNGVFADGDPLATQIQGPALQGAGTRFFWYPAKGALRSGTTTGTQWDDPQVGEDSLAYGLDTIASGDASFAGGQGVEASGLAAMAHGTTNTGGIVLAGGIASEAAGLAAGGGTISATTEGSRASGFALNSGVISATSQAAIAHGVSNGAGTAISAEPLVGDVGPGEAFGMASAGGTIRSVGAGTTARGVVSGGEILAQATGAIAHGLATGTNASLSATNQGAFAHGGALVDGEITAINGGLAGGIATGPSSLVSAGQQGSIAHGHATTAGRVNAAGFATTVFGQAIDGGELIATGGSVTGGSSVHGRAVLAGVVRAEEGGHAMGVANGAGSLVNAAGAGAFAGGDAILAGTVEASADGAHAFGLASGGAILASSPGATAGGFAQVGQSISAQTSFAARASGLADSASIISSGIASFAHGWSRGEPVQATGDVATAIGIDVSAQASEALATGLGTISDVEGVHVHGRYGHSKPNVTTVGVQPFPLTWSWQLGGGTSIADRNSADRGIAVIIFTQVPGANPIGSIIANNYIVGDADFAEYLEWADGNPAKEDRIGYFVAFDDKVAGKIRLAREGDRVIGITSGTAGVRADSAALCWHKSNLVDELGRPITRLDYTCALNTILQRHGLPAIKEGTPHEQARAYVDGAPITEEKRAKIHQEIEQAQGEEVLVPNPKKRPEEPYIPRAGRPEWAPVGMIGKIHVRDNGECQAGSYCDAKDGYAVPGDRWYVLERVSPGTIRVFFR